MTRFLFKYKITKHNVQKHLYFSNNLRPSIIQYGIAYEFYDRLWIDKVWYCPFIIFHTILHIQWFTVKWAPAGEGKSRPSPPSSGKLKINFWLYWRPFCYFFFIWGPFCYVFFIMGGGGGFFTMSEPFCYYLLHGGGLFCACPPPPPLR